jgi:cytochrome d ubiquinol oxidase subunit II
MAADAVGAILLASITMYAVFGGADFGGGFWDLVAGGDGRGWEQRQLIDESITPVWEGNHVWLVFALVIFWTAFPHAFVPVMTVLALPLWLALGGVVLRGAGFAFRKEITSPGLMRAAGATFAFSSLMTPFFMGVVVGAIASGAVPATGGHASLQAWTSETAILAGFVFVAACTYLAAVYLSGEAAQRSERRLQSYFSLRAQAAALVTGALSLCALASLHSSDPAVYAHLTGRGLPFVVVAGVCGLAVIGLLAARLVMVARVIAALGVAAVIWGWGVAQYPVLLPGTTVTLNNAGAPESTLVAMIGVAVLAVLLVVPSFGLLFSLQSRRMLRGEPHGPGPRADAWGASEQRGT